MHQQHSFPRLSRAALAALLAGSATPALTAASANAGAIGSSTAEAQPAPDQNNRDQTIYVTAPRLFPDIQPERSLDQDAIDSYGASTIDEILENIQVELGDDAEQPLIIVNGRRINDISEIGSLPVEVLRDIQVLPRGSALRAGGTGTQRVISITLKRRVRTATLTAAHKIATEGDWNGDRGEAIVTSVKGDTRANLTFRVRDETSLFESDRGIIQPTPSAPFALGGNIVGFPNTAGQIDPLLSALAGQPVTVVPLPASGTPTLAQLAALANQQNTTDLGRFRTLRPDTRNYDLNGTFATRLAPWLTMNTTLQWNHNNSRSLRGLPSALFVLSPTNLFSPFSNPVGLALYGSQPLRSLNSFGSRSASVTFDANWGSWQGNLNLRNRVSNSTFESQTKAAFATTIGDNVDPFGLDFTSLMTLRTDRTVSHTVDNLADLTFNGPLLALPAGKVLAVIEGRLGSNRLRSSSTFGGFGNGNFHRDEQSIRAGLQIPLTSHDSNFGAAIGDLSASVEYSRLHFSDVGSINHYTYAATWEPRPLFRLHASIDKTDQPPPIQTLGNPVTVTPDVRVFDPLTGETVDVTEISGGNPFLAPQSTKVKSVSALLRLVPRLNLQMNAEYTDTDVRNFVSSLPQASAAVELAFPDRFIRDANGVLTTVDLTPVNFDSHREKRLRWGVSMNAKLSGTPPRPAPGQPRPPSRPSTYFQLTANHTMVFSDEIVIRRGLDTVDLLQGGAIGIGGGRPRHQIDGTAAITSGGIGARVGVTWRGPNELLSRFNNVTDTLHFSPLLAVNLRAFADLKRIVPDARWAKGFRVSVDLINVFDRRQTVHDSFGNTPLQYQPAYRDPLGRTIEGELRKVF